MSKDYVVIFGAGVPVEKIKEIVKGLELSQGSFTVKCDPGDFATPESVAPIEPEKKKKNYKKRKPYYKSSSKNIIDIMLKKASDGLLFTAYTIYEDGKNKGLKMPAVDNISWAFIHWRKKGLLKKHYRGTYSLTPDGVKHFHGC